VKLIYFTKYYPDLSPGQLGEKARASGADGLDLAVRPGHAINPDNVAQALPAAVKIWQGDGLICPLVTADTALIDPNTPDARRLFAACGDAGVGLIKLGYWTFQTGQDYWRQVDAIRAALEGFGKLAGKHAVKAVYHTHSGGYFGCNCAGLMHLLRDQDPSSLGAYLDTGHLSLEGEPFRQGLAMVGEYLSAIAAKDYRRQPDASVDPPVWKRETVKLGEGFFDWRDGLAALSEAGFAGPCSVHGEYEHLDPAGRENWLMDDIALLRRLLGQPGP